MIDIVVALALSSIPSMTGRLFQTHQTVNHDKVGLFVCLKENAMEGLDYRDSIGSNGLMPVAAVTYSPIHRIFLLGLPFHYSRRQKLNGRFPAVYHCESNFTRDTRREVVQRHEQLTVPKKRKSRNSLSIARS